MKIAIVGAGINGATAAVELAQRGHDVTLLDPGPLPHPLAATTDISKVVRLEYGADQEYMELAEQALAGWQEWNREFGQDLFHQTGVLYLKRDEMKRGTYEWHSWRLLNKRKHHPQRLDASEIKKRFPAWNTRRYVDGFYDPEGGFAESGRVLLRLVEKALALGVRLRADKAFQELHETNGFVRGLVTQDGRKLYADRVLVTAGAWTHYLLPWLKPYFRANGMPVFYLVPNEPEAFRSTVFPVFAADTSLTGYYGFPINRDGVVKIARHWDGREMHPESDERVVTASEDKDLRAFLRSTFPALAQVPIIHRRICMYSDTWDGHFWIDHDPEHEGLVVAAGDSGHGFKFAPVLGKLIADAVEQNPNPLLQKFRWRPEVKPRKTEEVARFVKRK
ncbi:MAG: FAD-dependent oxidoreductase [Anaerolineae bacterium]|nr:FAD-dependent oxidoreductase [Anaerolineae bacterium]